MAVLRATMRANVADAPMQTDQGDSVRG